MDAMWFHTGSCRCQVTDYSQRHLRTGILVVKRDLRADIECMKRAEYSNADLIARLRDPFPVCVESIRWERQLLSPRRISDMARAAVMPETGRRRSRGGGKRSNDWGIGIVLNEMCKTDSGWWIISLFEFLACTSHRFDWFILYWDWLFRMTVYDRMDYETAQKGPLGPEMNIRFELVCSIVPFEMYFVERDGRTAERDFTYQI